MTEEKAKAMKQHLRQYRSLGRDISYDEYLEMHEFGLDGYYFNLCETSVPVEKFEIIGKDEKDNLKSLWTGWKRAEAEDMKFKLQNEISYSRKKIEISIVRIPYTYSILREHEKTFLGYSQFTDKRKEYALQINTPPIETYNELL